MVNLIISLFSCFSWIYHNLFQLIQVTHQNSLSLSFPFLLADIHPKEILISTRRPEILSEFSEVGIRCFFDNKKVLDQHKYLAKILSLNNSEII